MYQSIELDCASTFKKNWSTGKIDFGSNFNLQEYDSLEDEYNLESNYDTEAILGSLEQRYLLKHAAVVPEDQSQYHVSPPDLCNASAPVNTEKNYSQLNNSQQIYSQPSRRTFYPRSVRLTHTRVVHQPQKDIDFFLKLAAIKQKMRSPGCTLQKHISRTGQNIFCFSKWKPRNAKMNNFSREFKITIEEKNTIEINKQSVDLARLAIEYEFLEEIGSGHFGTVLRAKHRLTNVEVAIKVCNKDKGKENQLQAVLTLQHQNLPTVYQIVNEIGQSHQAFVMEYCPGGTLETIIELWKEKSEVNIELMKHYFSQILTAIVYMHDKFFIHFDIKPNNVLISSQHLVKLTDFSLTVKVKDLGSYNITGFKGSPWFMAPEMFGQTYCGSIADIWSLGCTFYCMFAGKPIFWKGEKFAIETYKEQAQEQKEIQRCISQLHLPPEIEEFQLLMLQSNPRKRSTAMEITKHKWIKSAINLQAFRGFRLPSKLNRTVLDEIWKTIEIENNDVVKGKIINRIQEWKKDRWTALYLMTEDKILTKLCQQE